MVSGEPVAVKTGVERYSSTMTVALIMIPGWSSQ